MTMQDDAGDFRRKGLGRGLSALLGEDDGAPASGGSSQRLPVELIKPNPNQPRRRFEESELDALSASIRERGVLQPIVVRTHPSEAGHYEIVAGERRWRAAQRAQLHEIPVVIKELDDGEVLEVALIENVQRADLNPIEEAAGYDRLMMQFGYTQEQLAQVIGKSRSHIANTLRLLGLPEDVQALVKDGRLSAGHGRALLASDDPEGLAKTVVAKDLSVREVERLAKGDKPATQPAAKSVKSPRGTEKDPDTVALEQDLAAALGLSVSIDHRDDSGGSITLTYTTLDQLDEICRRLCQSPPIVDG